jgi:hypothetical protein
MNSRTPGEWKAVPLGCGVGIYAEDGHCVAFTNSGSKSRSAVKNGTHGDEEQKANGELIALAPALLSLADRLASLANPKGACNPSGAEQLCPLIDEAIRLTKSSRNAEDSSLKKTAADTGESFGALAQSGGLGTRLPGQTGSANISHKCKA